MGDVVPMPKLGDVFTDIRGEGRTLRVSHHLDAGVLVISLWVDKQCRGSFRMPAGEVPRLLDALTVPVADSAEPDDPGQAVEVEIGPPIRRIIPTRWWDWARRRAS